MEQRTPPQPIAIVPVEPHFFGQQFGKSTDAFGMSAGSAIVRIHAGDHGQCRGNGLSLILGEPVRYRYFTHPSKSLGIAGP